MFKGLSGKLMAMLCLFSIALSAAIGVIGYSTYIKSVLARYQDFAVSILNLSYRYIVADDMAACLETGEKSALYHNTQIAFDTIKETTHITFLYYFAPNGDNMVYYINAAAQAERDALQAGEYIVSLGNSDPLPDEISEMLDNIGDEIWIVPNRSEYGYMMGAYRAVRDSEGNVSGILASEIDMRDISDTITRYVITVLLGAVLIMVLFTFFAILYLRRKVTSPIRALSESAKNFVDMNHNEELKPIINKIKTHDEIQTLSESFSKMTEDLIVYIENLTAVTAEKERIGAELSVATQIQSDMLPSIFPMFSGCEEFDIFALMRPAKEVGGDFYDFFYVNANTLAVVIADVSGKGVPAALFMVIAKTLIKNNAQRGISPKEVFETVNNLLCEGNESSMFVTAFMGYLEVDSGKFTFVNAGHNTPLIKQGNRYDWLQADYGLMLAGMEDMTFAEGEVQFASGDELYLYTDGVTEAMDINDKLFGDPRLLETVNQYTEMTPEAFTRELLREIDNFAGKAPQADDITMLTLKYKGV